MVAYLFIFSCTPGDVCKPAFEVGFGIAGVPSMAGPINSSTKFGILTKIYSGYSSKLYKFKVVMTFPSEIDIRLVSNENSKAVITRAENQIVIYHDFVDSTTDEDINVWLESRTDWRKWSAPITVASGLDFIGPKHCANYPDGHYEKVIKYSASGYVDSDWVIAPDGFRGVWKH